MNKGSSEHFTVCLVIFEENEEAQSADDRIALLRTELNLSADFEFHFNDNSDGVRQAFLKAVVPYNFFYFGFVVNKAQLYGDGFKNKESFYKYICGLVFENAKPHLSDAIVKIDGSGDQTFKRQLCSYLKRKINDPALGKTYIHKVSTPDSRGNNLVQLADMVCGAVARSYRSDKADRGKYRQIIKHREISVRFWPSLAD